jgi:hypothetical protein
MTETLIKTLKAATGEIYTTVCDRRALLARCRAAVEIIERVDRVDMPSGADYNVRTGYRVSLLCANIETAEPIDVDFLRILSAFEFTGDFQRKDGVFERTVLPVVPETLDLFGGDWSFHVNGSGELVKKLIAL